jgi:epoxide hydrolase 4
MIRRSDIEYQEAWVPTNGIRLHVVQAGPADGQPVVLLHGFPEFWYGWRKQIPALAAAGFRVIVPDQRGYNLSDKPRGAAAYTAPELIADILGLLDHFGYDKVCLAGHDWGAAVAWALAVNHRERFHGLAALNVPHPAVMLSFLRRDPGQMLRSWYIAFFQLPWLPEALFRARGWAGGVRLLRFSGREGTFTEEDFKSYRAAWSQPGAITAMIHWYRALARHRPSLPPEPRVRVPALILWGARDVALSRRMIQPSLEYCDDGRAVVLEEASHWVQHDCPEQVNAHLISFFRG